MTRDFLLEVRRTAEVEVVRREKRLAEANAALAKANADIEEFDRKAAQR